MMSSTRFFTASCNCLGEVARDFDELAGTAGSCAFRTDALSGAVSFFRSESIFGFKIIGSLDGHGAQGHNLCADHNADGFAVGRFFQPLTEVLPGRGDG